MAVKNKISKLKEKKTMKKYKDEYDFAEKVINEIPFVKNINIKVRVAEYSIVYTPRDGKGVFGGQEITATFMNEITGIIDGLVYAYRKLVK